MKTKESDIRDLGTKIYEGRAELPPPVTDRGRVRHADRCSALDIAAAWSALALEGATDPEDDC